MGYIDLMWLMHVLLMFVRFLRHHRVDKSFHCPFGETGIVQKKKKKYFDGYFENAVMQYYSNVLFVS